MTKTRHRTLQRRALRAIREAELSSDARPAALTSLMEALHISSASCEAKDDTMLATDSLASATLSRMRDLSSGEGDGKALSVSADDKRYFFHVWNERYYFDDSGDRFASPEEAAAHAARIAGELSREPEWKAFFVVVLDDSGRLVARKTVA